MKLKNLIVVILLAFSNSVLTAQTTTIDFQSLPFYEDDPNYFANSGCPLYHRFGPNPTMLDGCNIRTVGSTLITYKATSYGALNMYADGNQIDPTGSIKGYYNSVVSIEYPFKANQTYLIEVHGHLDHGLWLNGTTQPNTYRNAVFWVQMDKNPEIINAAQNKCILSYSPVDRSINRYSKLIIDNDYSIGIRNYRVKISVLEDMNAVKIIYDPYPIDHNFSFNEEFGIANVKIQVQPYEEDLSVPMLDPPPIAGAIPFYDFFNPTTQDHYYTVTYQNYDGYIPNNNLGYVFPSQFPGTVPLYRYFKASNAKHYYTINQGTYDGYVAEGIMCYVYPNQVSQSLPVYQTYHAQHDSHSFSNFPGLPEGTFEDVKFYTLQNSQSTTHPLPEQDCREIYMYYNSTAVDHYYSTSKQNYPNYVYEGLLGYISTIQKPNTIPLYQYNQNNKLDHYYTTVRQAYTNYSYEGILGYVYSSNQGNTIPISSYYNSLKIDHYYVNSSSYYDGYTNEGVKFYLLNYPY